jgi:hypothetical protein
MAKKRSLPLWIVLLILLILILLWLIQHCGDGGNQPTPEGKVVFVTSGVFDGNFGAGQRTLGHLAADQRCQEAARSAGLSGVFKAWISGRVDTGNGPLNHGVDDRFTFSSTPYRLVNGTQVAANWSDLTDGSLDHAINVTESGGSVGDGARVWTNTRADGSAWDNSTHCAVGPNPDIPGLWTWSCGAPSWTAGDCRFQSGKYGLASSATASWTGTGSSNVACNEAYHLYCFEQ